MSNFAGWCSDFSVPSPEADSVAMQTLAWVSDEQLTASTLSPLPICSSQIPCILTLHVNLIFCYYFWFNSAGGHAVLQHNSDFSAQLWLGMAGKELLQPTITLTSASCHAQASFVMPYVAYLAFRHRPALHLRSVTTSWTTRYWAGWFSAPCGGWETSQHGSLGLEIEIQFCRVSWVHLACCKGFSVAPDKYVGRLGCCFLLPCHHRWPR